MRIIGPRILNLSAAKATTTRRAMSVCDVSSPVDILVRTVAGTYGGTVKTLQFSTSRALILTPNYLCGVVLVPLQIQVRRQ